VKKFLSAILAFVYLSSSMGATVHLHYCMGKLISWGLIDENSKNCGFCGMLKTIPSTNDEISSNACCTDDHKQIKTDKDQKITSLELEISRISPNSSAVISTFQYDFHIFSFALDHPRANAPPVFSFVPVYILNCVYRI
jgi:hypothetical protein